MIQVQFTDEMSPSNAAAVADVLRLPRILIPTEEDYGAQVHDEWIERTEAGLIVGNRRALLATELGRHAGVVVWRNNPDEVNAIDIRNISIRPDKGGQLFGSFMLRLIETEIRQTGMQRVYVDTKQTNTDMIAFLTRQGYEVSSIEDLYASSKPDVILCKDLSLVA